MTTKPDFTDHAATPEADDDTSSSFAVGDLVTFTQPAPWAPDGYARVARIVAVGTPEGGDRELVQVEWVETLSGPLDPSTLEPYTPAV